MTLKQEDDLAASLGSLSLLNKIDRLRDLNIGHLVPLPQIVAVGDQSSGKSSVLESLTGFRFPRAPGLCTRYVTQITCRRVEQESIAITIIPGAGANAAQKEKLRLFRVETTDIYGEDFGRIFKQASQAMGIRGSAEDRDDNDDAALDTFSDDILKIEVNGPKTIPLTVIDVPGIFRAPTPGLTTENDIQLVRSMVERAIKDDRTIILAVVPCNVDIATQEILKMANDADPTGVRTMGVLTKPDLATEKATQQVVIDLVLGKRSNLKLGYCVVKNRSADDDNSSIGDRNDAEKVFFKAQPWCQLEGSKRTGVGALRDRLGGLIEDINRKEFPRVRADIQQKLNLSRNQLNDLGTSRSDPASQRSYLAEVVGTYQAIVSNALDAKYNRQQIFKDSKMKLITRIVESNEGFAATFATMGHKQHFEEDSTEQASRKKSKKQKEEKERDGEQSDTLDTLPLSSFPELEDILIDYDYVCPEPRDKIMDTVREVYVSSRGAELGTFGGNLLSMAFITQTEKWEHLVRRHTSHAIELVHAFIARALEEACPDERARTEIWNQVLLEKLQEAYNVAMKHADFLIRVECNGTPVTLNKYFSDGLDRARARRFQARIKKVAQMAGCVGNPEWHLTQAILDEAALSTAGNVENTCQDLHDILRSYYNVSRKRFVDMICQQVVSHFLLESEKSPLRLFNTKLVLDMSDEQLEAIAGEDLMTTTERERLAAEVKSLKDALIILRG